MLVQKRFCTISLSMRGMTAVSAGADTGGPGFEVEVEGTGCGGSG